MNKASAKSSTPVVVQAVAVDPNYSSPHAPASAVPVGQHGPEEGASQAFIAATAEPASNEATCRQCGRRFTRPPNVNSASAAYFRCEECNSSWMDIFVGSCRVM